MKKFLIAAMALCASACVSGTAQDDLNETQSLTFPGIPLASLIANPSITTDQSTTIDIHDSLHSLSDVGDVSVSINQSTLSGNVGFIQHVKITIVPTNGDPTRPVQTLTDANVGDPNNVDLPILMPSNTLVDYLSQGPVSLGLSLTGTLPQQDSVLSYYLSVHADVGVHKGI